jgi:diacylglycerol kinase family enzyme
MRAAFAAIGTEAEIQVVEGPHVKDVLRGVVSAQAPYVGVAGGDGTLSSAATVLAGQPTALLPIPLGTLNHFSQRYGLPSVEAAVHAWQRKRAHNVPVGFVNDVAFINNASCGFYPHVVRHRDSMEKVIPRNLANWLAGLLVLAKLPTMQLDLTIGSERRRLRTPALWVGLGRDSLRLPRPGDAEVDGETLEIVTPTAQRRTALVALMLRIIVKLKRGEETPEDKALDVLHTERFTLDSPHRIDVGIDGEPHRMRPSVHFRYERSGLKVLCLVAPS